MKAIRIVVGYFKQVPKKEKPEVKQKTTYSNINKKDIVEAEFEEISEDEK